MSQARRAVSFIIGLSLTVTFLLSAAAGPLLTSADPYAIAPQKAFSPMSIEHPLGTDELGRDLLERTLHGARLAFMISVVGVGLGALFGISVGVWVGFVGGILDRCTMRLVDVLLAFPGFLLALVAAAALGPGVGNLMIAVGFFSFPPFVRVARTLARSLGREEYVAAARTFGARTRNILASHILPNAAGPLCALAALRMAAALTTASGLSFIGLGPPLPAADWGSMLDMGRAYLWQYPRLVIVPGVALFWSSMGFYLLGEGIHERFRSP